MLNKIFLVLTFLFLNYSALAEDIKDFEIEGVSIGDSMLEHFTKDEIELNNLTADFKDKSVQGLLFQNIDFIVNYDAMQFVYKIKNMEIINITAMNHFKDNINLCKKKKKEIVRELSEMFSGATRTNEVTIHPADPSGKSKVISTYFDFNNRYCNHIAGFYLEQS